MPAAFLAFAFSSSLLIASLNLSTGWAPTRFTPLMKKLGVPPAPTLSASLSSSSTLAFTLGSFFSLSKVALSTPASPAHFV